MFLYPINNKIVEFLLNFNVRISYFVSLKLVNNEPTLFANDNTDW